MVTTIATHTFHQMSWTHALMGMGLLGATNCKSCRNQVGVLILPSHVQFQSANQTVLSGVYVCVCMCVCVEGGGE